MASPSLLRPSAKSRFLGAELQRVSDEQIQRMRPLRCRTAIVAGKGKPKNTNTAKVEMTELKSFAAGTEPVVITATKRSDSGEVSSSDSFPASQLKAAKQAVGDLTTKMQAMAAGTPLQGVASSPAGVWGVALGGVALVAASGILVSRALRGGGERTVDDLARRGFISADRSVPLKVIQDFEDPTAVRDYNFGGAKLVELEPLSPLTEEKIQLHREQRRREHGWKKPEMVLIEGEEVPEGVDPGSVRFIPKKHPFALSSDEVEEDWSEDVARRRLRQRRGRPEKEQQRSRLQLERLRKEMDEREASSGGGTSGETRRQSKSGVLPNIDD